MVATEFGLAVGQTDKSEILRLLSSKFTQNFKQGKRSLLIVDEAQGLALSALEELRLLTNLRIGAQPMLQIFLVGQEELRDMVTSPELEQLNQRMIAAYHMEPLKPDEFVAYVLHRLTVAVWKGNPRFEPALFPELFRFSNGLPRRINHICSRLLLHGFLEEKPQLDAVDMSIVIKELRAEHYAIAENTALITQDKFNPEDLQRMAMSAMSEQDAAVPVLTKEVVEATTVSDPPGCDTVSEPVSTNNPAQTDDTAAAVRQSAGLPGTRELDEQLAAPAVAQQMQSQSAGEEHSESDSIRKISVSGGRGYFRLPVLPVPAWAAATVLSVGLSLLLVISLPSQQLNRFTDPSLRNDIGLTRIRTLVSNWSGGRLPLQGINGDEFQPASPAVIERRDEEPGRALETLETAAESDDSVRPVSPLKREILGETMSMLSESGTELFN